MFDFTGKNILVTGATGGIGHAIVTEFAKHDCTIYATGTNAQKLESLTKEFGEEKCKVIACDLSDRNSIKELTDKVKDIDILVCNAGITKDNLMLRLSEEDWDSVLEINLTSIFLLTKALIRNMMKKKYGRIINITSIVAFSGNPGQANYCSAKAGLLGFSKSLALEVASRNITVNCIAPGFITTSMTDKLTDEQKIAITGKIPSGKLGVSKDIAAATLYLASEEAGYVTGQTLHVNGGMYL